MPDKMLNLPPDPQSTLRMAASTPREQTGNSIHTATHSLGTLMGLGALAGLVPFQLLGFPSSVDWPFRQQINNRLHLAGLLAGASAGALIWYFQDTLRAQHEELLQEQQARRRDATSVLLGHDQVSHVERLEAERARANEPALAPLNRH